MTNNELKNNEWITKDDYAEMYDLKDSTAYSKLENALKIAQEEDPNTIWTEKRGTGGSAKKYYKTELISKFISGPNVEKISKAYSKLKKENQRLQRENEKLIVESTFKNTRINELQETQKSLIRSINEITTVLTERADTYSSEIEKYKEKWLKSEKIRSNMLEFMFEHVPENTIYAMNFEDNTTPIDEDDIQAKLEEKGIQEELQDHNLKFITGFSIDKTTMTELIKKYSVNTKNPDPTKKLESTLSTIKQDLEKDRNFIKDIEKLNKDIKELHKKMNK